MQDGSRVKPKRMLAGRFSAQSSSSSSSSLMSTPRLAFAPLNSSLASAGGPSSATSGTSSRGRFFGVTFACVACYLPASSCSQTTHTSSLAAAKGSPKLPEHMAYCTRRSPPKLLLHKERPYVHLICSKRTVKRWSHNVSNKPRA